MNNIAMSTNKLPGSEEEFVECAKPKSIEIETQEHIRTYQPDETLSFYSTLSTATNPDEFKEAIQVIIEKMGFSDFYFSFINTKRNNQLTSFTPDICTHLTEEDSKYHPLLAHALRSETSLLLSTIYNFIQAAPFVCDPNHHITNLAKTMQAENFNDCYCIPREITLNKSKNTALFIVAQKGLSNEDLIRKIETSKHLMQLLGEAIALISAYNFPNYFLSPNPQEFNLTEKNLQLLNILAKENITLKNAAQKVCMSLDTANKHIAAVKKALGANTQAAAVYFAIQQGLIAIEEN